MADNTPSREVKIDEAIAAYLDAERAGRAPTSGDWLAANAEIAAELKSFLADRAQFARMAAPLVPPPVEAATLGIDQTLTGSPLGVIRYFGDYELLEEIARGGMGVVYRARQVSLNRVVALKMILTGQLASEADVQRFKSEAEAAGNLDHPNIVPIHEVGEHNGQHYFSMKLIEGGSLAGLRTDGRSVARLMATVARAVHHAHQRGVLHRDLKPANILLAEDKSYTTHTSHKTYEPYVTDFGLARRVEADSQVTRSGSIVGTPAYMPPEQARGEKQLTVAADVYSLGAVLYELLAGRPPFGGPTPLDTLLAVLEREPARPRSFDPSVNRDLETICLKCLEKDPKRRYPSASDLADDLQRWLDGVPIVARPTGAAERMLKWARRRPAVAALTATLAATMLAAFVGLAIFSNVIAEKQIQTQAALDRETETAAEREAALKREKLASDQRATALGETERSLQAEQRAVYQGRFAVAQNEWRLDNVERADAILKECPEPLRRWEWHHLRRLCRAEQHRLEAHGRAMNGMTFSPDSRLLLTWSADGKVRLWDAATGAWLRDFRRHGAQPTSAAFSPDGARVVSCSSREVFVWETATAKTLTTITDLPSKCETVTFSADGQRVLSVDGDSVVSISFFEKAPELPSGKNKQLRVWDAATGKPLSAVVQDKGVAVAAVSSDGKHLATASDGVVSLRDPATGKEMFAFPDAEDKVVALFFGSRGDRLVAATEKQVVVWDVAARKTLLHVGGKFGGVTATHAQGTLALSPDGRRLVVAGMLGQRVRVFDVTTRLEVEPIRGHADVCFVAFSPDGSRLATASGNPILVSLLQAFGQPMPGAVVKLWDARGDQEARALRPGGD